MFQQAIDPKLRHEQADLNYLFIELLSRADRGREMGKLARVNAKKKFCANDVIPTYERYYQRVLSESRTATA